jgi:hypothetical protein
METASDFIVAAQHNLTLQTPISVGRAKVQYFFNLRSNQYSFRSQTLYHSFGGRCHPEQ